MINTLLLFISTVILTSTASAHEKAQCPIFSGSYKIQGKEQVFLVSSKTTNDGRAYLLPGYSDQEILADGQRHNIQVGSYAWPSFATCENQTMIHFIIVDEGTSNEIRTYSKFEIINPQGDILRTSWGTYLPVEKELWIKQQ